MFVFCFVSSKAQTKGRNYVLPHIFHPVFWLCCCFISSLKFTRLPLQVRRSRSDDHRVPGYSHAPVGQGVSHLVAAFQSGCSA